MDTCKLDGFLDFLYENAVGEVKRNTFQTPEEFQSGIAAKRVALKSALGLDKLEAYEHDVKVREVSFSDHAYYTIKELSIDFLPRLSMPAFIISPKNEPKKLRVLYAHGHGKGGCRDTIIEKSEESYHKSIPLMLAKRGYEVFLFEPAGFGDLTVGSYKSPQESGCYALSSNLLMHGMTTLGLRIYQAMCLTKYMRETLHITDVATAGISGGGTVCAFYGAVSDDMKANVISCYNNMFRTSIMDMRHCVCNYVPGLLGIGEMPDIIAMGAPKKLFISNGSDDRIYPMHGAQKSYEQIYGVYKMLGHEGDIENDFFNGGHEISFAFIDWLDKI